MGTTEPFDLVVENGRLATFADNGLPYGAVHDGVVAVRDGRIDRVGERAAVASDLPASRRIDARGGWVTPGLIDCHTHLIFGGTRIGEFEARLGGTSYEELARTGGGILSTVAATRAASVDALTLSARRRLDALAAHGVTALEIKSGYGLDVETELAMLSIARELGRTTGMAVRATLLGAHALPPEFAHDRAGYVDLVCSEMIPAAAEAGLADAVDAFCEEIAFTPEECARVFEAGRAHGLAVRLHADQRTDSGGAALAAAFDARSADHLECTNEGGVRAMADAGTAAVLLPGAAYFLGDPRVPPIEAFRAHGVPMAVATDLNPGSSPVRDPLLALNMACTLFGLTPEESVAGMTREAARVLGWGDVRGTLEAGKIADLLVWDVERPAELCYWLGGARPSTVTRAGEVVGA